MTKLTKEQEEEIEQVWRQARQPREGSWRFWLKLLVGKPKPKPEEGLLTVQDLLEYKPHIALLCEPMFGRTVRGTHGPMNVRPSLELRINLYLEALDIIREFNQVDDLLRLGVFRREVTRVAGLEVIDRPFYELVLHLQVRRKLSSKQIKKLAERMPKDSALQEALFALNDVRDLPLAAD